MRHCKLGKCFKRRWVTGYSLNRLKEHFCPADIEANVELPRAAPRIEFVSQAIA